MNNFNIYAAEAGALNLEAQMSGRSLQEVFSEAEFEPLHNWPRNTSPAQYKARVGVYVKKMIKNAQYEAELSRLRAKKENERRAALGEDGRAREDAYLAAEREAYAKITETGQARKRRKYKIRQQLRAKFCLKSPV